MILWKHFRLEQHSIRRERLTSVPTIIILDYMLINFVGVLALRDYKIFFHKNHLNKVKIR